MMRRVLVLSFTLLACGAKEDVGHAEAPTAEPPADETAAAVPEETNVEASDEAEGARARAISTAEAFVRAQGYTDVPPTVSDDEIVHEWIEGSITMRLNMLVARAVTANGEGDDWMVIFRYRDPQYEGRGRAVRLSAGETPHLVHQDVIVSAWE